MSIDEIAYELNFFPEPSNSKGEQSLALVALVVSKLPPNIQEKVFSDLYFICLDGVYGQYERLSFPIKKRLYKGKNNLMSIVFLNRAGMKRMKPERQMTIVAHEIAHFILGHHDTNGGEKIERETDDLCESWGFGRAYKSYKIFKV